ncbi:hypothetical protein D3C72_1794510 [compost metagenome]
MHPRRAQRAPLPPALVDQPAGRELVASIRLGIRNQTGKAVRQFVALGRGHDRILEEAAGIARDRRIGQLGPADIADGIENVARAGRPAGQTFVAQQIGIAQHGPPRPRQGKAHADDDPASGFVVLERTVAVGKAAIRRAHLNIARLPHVPCRQAVKALF